MAARLATILVAAIVGTTLIAGLIVGAQRDDSSGPVDLIIHNARVYAADDLGTMAEAIAIRGNKILKVGSEREIMRYRRPQTALLDAKGAAVLPGFDDAHASFVARGLAGDTVQLFGAADLDDVRERIESFAASHPDATWITGYGWSHDTLGEPTRLQLDAVVSDRPVALLSEDGAALWLNTRALTAAGITRRTLLKTAGIARDRRNEPTGLVKADAMALVDRVTPKATREDRVRGLQLGIRDAQQRGITSVQDLGALPGDLDLYDAAREAGTLGVRVYAAIQGATSPDDLDAVAHRFPDDPLLKTGLSTLSLDGTVESQSAAMLERDAQPSAAAEGTLAFGAEELAQRVRMLDARGWQIAIEASGDRAVRAALDALGPLAKARKSDKPRRHRIEGLAVVDPEDMPRFGALGVIASMQPLQARVATAETWTKNVGPDRLASGWPARSLSAAGAHLAFGSGTPNLPFDPLDSVRAAVSRDELQAPEQLTLKSAINGWTSGAAWASFDEHRKGTLKPGMLADLVILSTDIFRGPAQLKGAEVVTTIFDGKVVYRRPS